MNKTKELIKNTIILMIGKICTQFISFLLLPLYTTILASSEFGIVDLITTYVGLIIPIITVQLEMALFRFLIDSRNNEENKKKIISNVGVSATILLIFSLIIYLLICICVNFDYKLYLALIVISGVYVGLLLQVARGLGDNLGYSIASVISAVVTIALNIVLLVIFKLGPVGMFISTIMANVVSSLFLFFREKVYNYISFEIISKEKINELVKYSLPLVPNGVIWWIINASDRTIISIFIGTAANGIYAVSNKFSSLFINLYNIFNLSWTESVSLHINDNDEFLSNTINKSLNIFSSMILCLISGISIIFPIMINKEYALAYNYIPILLLGSLFNVFVSMLGSIYVAKKLTKEISKTSFYSGLLNIILNLLFVKMIGIYAAALSTVLSFFIMSVYRYFDVQKYIKLKLKYKKLLPNVILLIVINILYYINFWLTNIISLLVSISYFLFSNRDFIKNTFETIINKFFKKGNKCQKVK